MVRKQGILCDPHVNAIGWLRSTWRHVFDRFGQYGVWGGGLDVCVCRVDVQYFRFAFDAQNDFRPLMLQDRRLAQPWSDL